MRPLDALSAAIVVLIWALHFVVGKVGVSQLPPLLMMSMRLALVALLLLPFLRRAGPWRLVLTLGVVFGGFHYGLLFTGLRRVDAGLAAIAIQLGTPFSVLLAALFDDERLTARQLLGMAVAFSGVILLAGEPRERSSLPHFLLVVGGALAWAVATLLIRRLAAVPPLVLNGWVAVIASPLLLLASLALEEGQLAAVAAADARGWGAVLYAALLASIVAYGLWYRLLARYEIQRVVPLTLLAPVLAVLLASLLLGEPLTPRILVAGTLVVAGVALVVLRSARGAPGAPARSV